MELTMVEPNKEGEKLSSTTETPATRDLNGVSAALHSDLTSLASPAAKDEIRTFQQDLSRARKELKDIATYLNVLFAAYNNAHGAPMKKHHETVDRIGGKLISALTFYRNSARKLAIHCRTAQETQQSSSLQPPAEYYKLERLKAELDQLKTSVSKLVPQDYSVFDDLKLISAEDVVKLKPELFAEGNGHADTDVHHRIFCAQIEYEQERRKKVMQEIDVLLKKRKNLQDEVKKRKDCLSSITADIDDTGKKFLESLAQKLNFTPTEISRDIGQIGPSILEAFFALQNRQEESSTVAEGVEVAEGAEGAEGVEGVEVDVEMADVSEETPIVTPEAVSHESPGEVLAREEGEASDEGEGGAPSPSS